MAYPVGFSRFGASEEEVHACAKDTIPEGDHSCGCDGACDDGCAWCTEDQAELWLAIHRPGKAV